MKRDSSAITVKIPLSCPAMRAALAFAAGIITCVYFNTHVTTLLLLLFAGYMLHYVLRRHNMYAGILAFSVLFLTGMCVYTIQNELNRPLHFPGSAIGQIVRVEGVITGDTRINYGNTRFILRCRSLETGDGIFRVSGLLPCTLYNNKMSIPEGSQIIIYGKIKLYRRPFMKQGTVRFSPYPDFTHRLVTDDGLPAPFVVERGASIFRSIRNHISSLIDRYPFGGHGDLLKTMTIGERDVLPRPVKEQFARTGISHILAVSGLHVGILVLALNLFLKLFPVPKKIRFMTIIGFMICYAGICGFRPPVTRSVFMISMVLGALVFERPKNPENSIFAALIAILAFDPSALFGPSLQLSFAAVWGIVTFFPPVMSALKQRFRFNRITEFITGTFVVSVIAAFTTAPIAAAHFGFLPLYGILANLIAVWLAFLIIYSGIVSIFLISLGTIAAPLAALFSFFTGLLLKLLFWLTGFVSGLPYASIPVGGVPFLVGVCLAVWLYVISRSNGRSNFKKAILYIPLMLLFVYSWHPLILTGRFGVKPGSVIFFDVGQGDAALIKYGNNRHFLIDTGPAFGSYDAGTSVILPGLRNAGISYLDGIFLSHTHSDHTGGIFSILQNIRTGYIFSRYSIADSLSALFGRKVTGVSAGDSIAFNDGGILVLSPASEKKAVSSKKMMSEILCLKGG